MSVKFTSTIVDTLEAFIYYSSDLVYTPGKQPFNNSPGNFSAEQYGYVTGNAQDGISIKYTTCFVSIQGTDSKGNIYYWVSFNIDPPSNQTNSLKTTAITTPNTVVDLDKYQYYPLYVCDGITPCPDGLGCFNDPITKKSYCTGIGTQGTNWGLIIIMVLIIIILLCVVAVLAVKLFHVINVSK